jgi:hypothetical protein
MRPQYTKPRPWANKQGIGVCTRPACSHVGCNRLPHFPSQRQARLTAPLAADMNPPVLPVDVTQTHLDDIPARSPRRASKSRIAPIALANR